MNCHASCIRVNPLRNQTDHHRINYLRFDGQAIAGRDIIDATLSSAMPSDDPSDDNPARGGQPSGIEVTVGIDQLEAFLSADDPDVREYAASTLADEAIERPGDVRDVVPTLIDRLEDHRAISASVTTALAAVAQRHPEAVAPGVTALTERLEGPADITADAVDALAAIAAATPDAVTVSIDPLAECLSHADERIAKRASAALLACGESDPVAVASVSESVTVASSHDSQAVRAAAIGTLRAIATTEPDSLETSSVLLSTLFERLADDPEISADAMAALRALVEHDPTLPALQVELIADQFADDRTDVRLDAARTLAAIAAESPTRARPATGPLVDTLGDSPAVRQAAVRALCDIAVAAPHDEEVVAGVPALVERLADTRSGIRTDAAATLEAIATDSPAAVSSAVQALAECLDDVAADTREHAAAAIEGVARDHPEAVSGVVTDVAAGLEDDRRSIGELSATTLEAVAEADPAAVSHVVPQLTRAIQDDLDSIRRPCARALAAVAAASTDDPDTVASHAATLGVGPAADTAGGGDADGTDDDWLAGHAARSLAVIATAQLEGVHPAIRAAVNRLESDELVLRRAATRDLLEVAATRPAAVRTAVEPLADALTDEDASVRNNAILALAKLAASSPADVRQVLDRVFAVVDDPDRTVRANAVVALRALGPETEECRCEAFELVLEEMDAAEPTIRAGALGALPVLGPETGAETTRAVYALLDRLDAPSCTAHERVRALSALETLLTGAVETNPTPAGVLGEALEKRTYRDVTPQALAELARVDPSIVTPFKTAVIDALGTSSSETVSTHCRTLTHLTDPSTRSVAAVVRSALDDPDVAFETIATLAASAPTHVAADAPALVEALTHDEDAVRGYATLALTTTVTVGALEEAALADALEDVDDRLVDAASLVAGGDPPTHTDAINSQLSGFGRRLEAEPWSSGVALCGLAALADVTETLRPTAVSKLADGLDADSPVVRVSAARLLDSVAEQETTGFENAAPALISALEDSNATVRTCAARTLATLVDSPGGFEELEEAGMSPSILTDAMRPCLSDYDCRVRHAAVRLLGTLPDSDVGELEVMTDDPVATVSQAAVSARSEPAETTATRPATRGEWLDWQMARSDAAGTASLPDGEALSASVDARWATTLPGTATPAVVVGDTVFVGTESGRLMALALEDGHERWSTDLEEPIRHPPAVDDEQVYVVTEGGTLCAFDAGRGRQCWTRALGDRVETPPVVADETLFLGAQSDVIITVDTDTGGVAWECPLEEGTDADIEGEEVREIVVGPEDVFVGTDGGRIFAIDRDGTSRWQQDLESGERPSPPIVSLAVDTVTGHLLAAGGDGTVYGLSPARGDLVWRFTTGGPLESGLAVAHGTAFVASGDLSVYAISLETGAERFRFDTGGPMPSAPVVVDDVCVVGTDDGGIYALDGDTGTARWRYDLEDGACVDGVTVASGLCCARSGDRVLLLGDEDASWSNRLSGLFSPFNGKQ